MYIHCNLVAWDPETLDDSKKACNYDQEHGRWWRVHHRHLKFSASLCWRWPSAACSIGRWELLDDPRQNSLCSCCDSTCKSRPRREVHLGICNAVLTLIVDFCVYLFQHFSFYSLFSQCSKMSFSLSVCSESQGFSHKSVLGPLIIVDQS